MKLTSEYFESADITVWQPAQGHRYGEESLALADFVKITPGQRVAELGSGTGLISLLIAAKQSPSIVMAIEVQESFHQIAQRNVHENRFPGIVHCINDDYRNFAKASRGSFDCVISNPPFYRATEGRLPPDPMRAAARHELNGTIEDLTRSALALLSSGGSFFVVFDARRSDELKRAAETGGFKSIRIESPQGSAYVLAEFRK